MVAKELNYKLKTVLHPPCDPFTTGFARIVRLEGIRYDITLTFSSPKLLTAVIDLCFEANSDSNKIHKNETTWLISPKYELLNSFLDMV